MRLIMMMMPARATWSNFAIAIRALSDNCAFFASFGGSLLVFRLIDNAQFFKDKRPSESEFL